MNDIFDKEKRIRAHVVLHKNALIIPGIAESLEYLKALEEIAQAAQLYIVNSTPVNGAKLDTALERVDRMRE